MEETDITVNCLWCKRVLGLNILTSKMSKGYIFFKQNVYLQFIYMIISLFLWTDKKNILFQSYVPGFRFFFSFSKGHVCLFKQTHFLDDW